MTNHPIIRGEFTVIENRLSLKPVSFAGNPLGKAHAALVEELHQVMIPTIHITPSPEEFEDTADYVLRMAGIFDRWLKAVGEEADANSVTRVDMVVFSDTFSDALEGNATFELDRCADAIREERAEYRDDTDYRRAMR